MTEKVTKLALASRVMVLLLQWLANVMITDHRTQVFRTPYDKTHKNTWLDTTINVLFGGLRHWDGEYFLHIAEFGYSYENTLAFYPLYPLMVGYSGRILHYLAKDCLTLRSCCLLMAVILNVIIFCKAASLMYQVTQRIFNDATKSWNATLLFCFNPASIFFTAAYSETLFALMTFYVMLESVTELRFIRCSVPLALNFITRSNGLINVGFPLYFLIRRSVLRANQSFFCAIKLICILLLSLIPATIFNFYQFQQFCNSHKSIKHSVQVEDYAREKNYILAGQSLFKQSPWCEATLPFPYSYVQSHYWDVGFLKYYQLKQFPNFLIALPVLGFLIWHFLLYLKHFACNLLPRYPLQQLLKEYKTLPFILHALILCLICVAFVHIQIATRLLCSASPCLYWFAADYLPKSFDKLRLRSRGGLVVIWFATYSIIGCLLFSNNFPWT